MRNQARMLSLAATALWLTGCTTVSVDRIPADATSKINNLIASAQVAARNNDAMGWGSRVTYDQVLASPPDVEEFISKSCQLKFYSESLAGKMLETFSKSAAEIAKAPEDSITAYIRNIQELDQKIKDMKLSAAAPGAPPSPAALVQKCLANVKVDLAIGEGGPAHGLGPALDVFNAIVAIIKDVTKIAEQAKRAEALKAYVLNHRDEIYRSLDVLGGTKDQPAALDNIIATSRTYYIRSALVSYQSLKPFRKSGQPQPNIIDSAERYTAMLGKYSTLMGASGAEMINGKNGKDGVRQAFDEFMTTVTDPNKDPLSAIDNLLLTISNVTDLNSDWASYKKAASGDS